MSQASRKPVAVIDCSLKGVSMGLYDYESLELLSFSGNLDTYGSSQNIATDLKSSFEGIGSQVSDLYGLIVAHGPGSFTGIKIGIAFGQGLIRGLTDGPRFLGESAMAGFLDSLPIEDIAILGATKTHGYVAYRGESGEALHGVVRISAGQLFQPLPLKGEGKIHLMQPWNELTTLLDSSGERWLYLGPEKVAAIANKGLASLGIARIKAGETNLALQPQYLRKAAVEEKIDEKR